MLPIPNFTLYVSPDLAHTLFLPDPAISVYYHRPPTSPAHVAYFPYLPPFHLHIRQTLAALRLTTAGQADIARNHAILTALRTYANLLWTAATLAAATPSPPTIDDDPLLLTGLLSGCRWFVRCPACSAAAPFTCQRPRRCLHCQTPFPKSHYPEVHFLSTFDSVDSACYISGTSEDQHG